jgi:predicted PolB exonuclease-like 3'-5' exonuclease
MTRRRKWDPERMKAAIETVRNKEMGSYKASSVFNLAQATLQSCVRDGQERSSEAIKQKWVGSKYFLVK